MTEQDLNAIRQALTAEPRRPQVTPDSSSVLALLVPTREDGLCFLFERRRAGDGVYSGQLGFPGGRREASDRNPLETALRETQEELGVGPSRIDVLGHLDDRDTHLGKRVMAYVGSVSEEDFQAATPSPLEVDELLLIPIAELSRGHAAAIAPTDSAFIYHVESYEGRQFAGMPVMHYWKVHRPQPEGEAVLWGFTAGLVAHYLQTVHGWKAPRQARPIGSRDEIWP